MAIITEEMKQFIENNRPSYVATASADGIPNVSPKRTIRVLDEQHLAFADILSPKTRKNLKENNNVCVLLVNAQEARGYQFKGKAEYLTSGDLFDRISSEIKERMPQFPPVQGVVKIKVDEIFEFGQRK